MAVIVADEVPWSDEITPYDEAHLTIYLRLLDAKADGADEQEMASIVLEIDPACEPERTRAMVASHLRRAEWLSQSGYRHLLRRG